MPHKKTHVLRANAHEYLLAESAIKASQGQAFFSTTSSQELLRKARYASLQLLPARDVNQIRRVAERAIAQLPLAVGQVTFPPVSSNGNEVYDVLYQSGKGRVAVSAKLKEMEDKAYRFSSKDYPLRSVNTYNRMLFHEADGKTVTNAAVLQREGLTLREYQKAILSCIENALNSPDHEDYVMFQRLIRERFIGAGDYYKALGDGSIRYYPSLNDEDQLLLDLDSIQVKTPSIFFRVSSFSVAPDGTLKEKARYDSSFRVKWKDGINKPVSFSREGHLGNIAATVKFDLTVNDA